MATIQIEFINQAGGPLLRELVQAAAEAFGPVLYHTADTTGMQAPVSVIAAPRYRRHSLLARLTSWVSYTLVASFRVLFAPRRPLLFIVTNPPFAPLIGYLAKIIKRQSYVILFYDFYPEAMEQFMGVSPSSIISKVMRVLNRIAVQNASGVITISKGLEKTLSQYYPKNGNKINTFIIPTWVDTNSILPMPKAENVFAQEHGQTDKITVLYSGNIGSAHDLSIIPDLADQFRDNTKLHFMVMAESAGRRELEIKCQAKGLMNITFLPLQDEAVLPYSLATADIGLVALARGAEGISMPSKTYYLMAAGCAILSFSRPDSDLAEVIHKHHCGINVLPNDLAAATAAIQSFLEDPAALASFRANARRAAISDFSRGPCVARMLGTISPILTGRNAKRS